MKKTINLFLLIVVLFVVSACKKDCNCNDDSNNNNNNNNQNTTGTFTDTRDGKTYNWVKIGTQTWMSQNMNYGTQVNRPGNQTNNGVVEKYCYKDEATNCLTYGGLYKWDEMMQYTNSEKAQGICPAGWHIPSDGEWKQMEMALGMSQAEADITGSPRGANVGGTLKTTGTVEAGTGLWKSPNTNATNSSGFSALPGGNTYYTYDYSYVINEQSAFWTSTQGDALTAWSRNLAYNVSEITRYNYEKGDGMSVRCVKD